MKKYKNFRFLLSLIIGLYFLFSFVFFSFLKNLSIESLIGFFVIILFICIYIFFSNFIFNYLLESIKIILLFFNILVNLVISLINLLKVLNLNLLNLVSLLRIYFDIIYSPFLKNLLITKKKYFKLYVNNYFNKLLLKSISLGNNNKNNVINIRLYNLMLICINIHFFL